MEYGFSEYQKQAMALRIDRAWAPQYAVNGLPGEVGELLSIFAKAIRDGEKDDHKTMVKKELGDCLWFLAAIAYDNDLDLEDVASGNIAKLTDRKNRGVLQGSGDNR
jgi:NTP pyrophosphatase (non-canonical NTP hydrolase)